MRLTDDQKRELRAKASRGAWAIGGWAPAVLALLDEIEELKARDERNSMSDFELEANLGAKRMAAQPQLEIMEIYDATLGGRSNETSGGGEGGG